MICLTLLHPVRNLPVQTWDFERQPVIRIGRGTDNDVVLYSAVVSRHHVELRRKGTQWELFNLGTNGTYIDGKRVNQTPVTDGLTLRLARSGPYIQIHLSPDKIKDILSEVGERTTPQIDDLSPDGATRPSFEQNPITDINEASEARANHPPARSSAISAEMPTRPTYVLPEGEPSVPPKTAFPTSPASHTTSGLNLRFDPETGRPLQVLQTLANYDLLSVIGQGSVAVTYLAWSNGQTLAVKTANEEWAGDPEVVKLFAKEARLLQQLQHPALPQFVDFFTLGDRPYIVMEMIYGQDLSRYIAEYGPVSQTQAIQWLLQVCDTLAYLHNLQSPVVHHDLRPNNLIRRAIYRLPTPEIAILDVGAARVVGIEDDETHIGLASYAAPEKQEGHPLPVSDLYSLGPILIYLLTGQNPSHFFRLENDVFRLVPEGIPNLTPAMVAVVRKLTDPDPEQRYSDAAAVAAALKNV